MSQSIQPPTGVEVNYYLLCKKKLWYFVHGVRMEHASDAVYLGKLIHEESYGREKKEIDIDDTIKLDFIGKDKVVHEIKKSNRVEAPHIWQLKYYIWYLEQKGVEGVTGKINYPKLKRTVDVKLEKEDHDRIIDILAGIEKVKSEELPPRVDLMRICKNCSYYDICWI